MQTPAQSAPHATGRAISVPMAQAGPITDDTLEELARIGRKLQDDRDEITEGEGVLVMLTLATAMEELLHRRRAMGVIGDMIDLDNVTFMQGR